MYIYLLTIFRIKLTTWGIHIVSLSFLFIKMHIHFRIYFYRTAVILNLFKLSSKSLCSQESHWEPKIINFSSYLIIHLLRPDCIAPTIRDYNAWLCSYMWQLVLIVYLYYWVYRVEIRNYKKHLQIKKKIKPRWSIDCRNILDLWLFNSDSLYHLKHLRSREGTIRVEIVTSITFDVG